MLASYRTVADRSPLPVIIYNFPQVTAYDIPVAIVAELAEHPNIVGIKESRGSVEKVQEIVGRTRHIKRSTRVTEVQEAVTGRMLKQAAAGAQGDGDIIPVGALESKPSSSAVEVLGALKTRPKEIGFQVLVGSAQELLPALEAGAVGAILQFACAAPTAFFEVYLAWKERAAAIAQEKQQRIAPAAKRISSELGIPGTKYAMDLNGYYGGGVRLPLLPLTGDQKTEVENLMERIKA
jgi:dihydrodipicolinate synthase/N-acetylneuraminate lyase